jgi:AdoMet-dependent heme synthase
MHWLYDASKYIRIKTTEGHHYKRVVLQRSILEAKGIEPSGVLDLGATYRRLTQDLKHIVAGESGQTIEPERASRSPMHINAGKGFVFISRQGDVYPSGFMPVSGGNVRDTSLVEIYRTAPLFRTLRNLEELEGRCGDCEFKTVCGGSRSRAYAITGRAVAEEPFCTYRPGSFPYQEELALFLKGTGRPE